MKKLKTLFPVLSVLNLLLTAAVIVFLFSSGSTEELFPEGQETLNCTLYIGLNDKDTYTQLIETEDARAAVDEICLKYAGGFTAFEARGGWTDENGISMHENTLVYMISGASRSQITAIMDEVLEELNQSAILVSTEKTETFYYSEAEKD